MRAQGLALLLTGTALLAAGLGWSAARIQLRGVTAPILKPVVLRVENTRVQMPPMTPRVFPGSETAEEARVRDGFCALAAMDSSLEQRARMLEWVRSLSPAECRIAMTLVRRSKERIAAGMVELIATRWAELDPAAAAGYVLGIPGARWDVAERRFLEAVMQVWATHDPAQAQEWITGHSSDSMRTVAGLQFATALAEREPAAALEFLSRLGAPGPVADCAAGEVLKLWAQRDPQAAAAAIGNFPWVQGAAEGYAAVAFGWGARDPRAAMEWAATAPLGQRQWSALNYLTGIWAAEDAAGMIRWLQSQPDFPHHTEVLVAAFSAAARLGPREALAQLQELPANEERARVAETLAVSMRVSDPRTAVALLDEAPPTERRAGAIESVAEAWAESEPKEALDWLTSRSALTRNRTTERMISQWLATAPDAALDWARGLPAGENRNVALGMMAGMLAEHDVSAAQQLFGELEPFAQAIAGTSIAENLSRQSVSAALQWAATLPEGQARYDAFGRVGEAWAQKDEAAAAGWLNTLPAGPPRDRAIEGYASVIVDKNAEAAMTWASSIADAQLRAQVLDQLYSTWLRSDASKARSWAASTPALTDGQRQRLLRN